MFFKKKPEPPKLEYPTELDTLRDSLPILINLSKVKDSIMSIERVELNTPDEETVAYVLKENGQCDEYVFKISRNQHAKLIQEYSQPTTATNS